MQKLSAFFRGDELVKDLAADADTDLDPITFHWLTVRDSNPDNVNHIPEEAAGALVFVRGDAAAKALSEWAESKGLLVRR